LRAAVNGYLRAVDAWEEGYEKYYRISAPGQVSSDLALEHQSYLIARRELQTCLPRARRLCFQHGLREPWTAILHIHLGARTPQTGAATAIGRAERAVLAQCLDDLESACRPQEARYVDDQERPGIVQRLMDYFL
jgi:hypothetical protein